jgi:glycosyltransferase involved in cell wall biosynthesis
MYHADLIGGLAAAYLGIPLCWGVRQSNLSWKFNRLSTLLVMRICALLSGYIPARIISCSVRATESHQSIGYKARFETVPNGFDVARWIRPSASREQVRSILGVPLDAFLFAHAGRDDPQKDHASLALAFSSVVSQGGDVWLLLCGRHLEPGATYFEALPFTPSARRVVIALGVREDLPVLWQACDAFVLSSIGEAFPNVVAEAMASGMPCIVTDVGDAASIVGETGWVVPPANVGALTEAMRLVVDMTSAERTHLGVAARLRVANTFTLDRMVKGFEEIWLNVLQGRLK